MSQEISINGPSKRAFEIFPTAGLREERLIWLTIAAAMSAVWLGTIGVTMAIGPIVSRDLPLSFAPIAVLVGLLGSKLRRAPARRAALAAAIGAGIATVLAHDAALIVGVCSGIAVESLKKGLRR